MPITSLSLSINSSLLLVGTTAGTIQIYDIASHQYLRSITTYKDKGLHITSLATMMKPLDLIGHVNLSLNADPKDGSGGGVNVKIVVPFMKMKDGKARERREIWMMGGHVDDDESSGQPTITPLAESILHDHASFFPASPSSTSNGTVAPSIESLQTELVSLRDQLGKAKAVNDIMWERVVQKVLVGGKEKDGKEDGGDEETDDERARKRGRT